KNPPRSQIVAALGKPDAVCESHSHGHCWRELYVVSGKYPNPKLAVDYADTDLATLGVAEVVLFPAELLRSAYKSMSTGTLGVVYCTLGTGPEPFLSECETFLSSHVDGAASEQCKVPEDWAEGLPF